MAMANPAREAMKMMNVGKQSLAVGKLANSVLLDIGEPPAPMNVVPMGRYSYPIVEEGEPVSLVEILYQSPRGLLV